MADMGEIINKSLVIPKATTKTYKLYFTDSDGEVVDITGWTIFFTLKENLTDTDGVTGATAKIEKDITTHTDPTGGETEIVLSATDTNLTAGSYSYDIKVATDDGDIEIILEGNISIVDTVTTRSS